MRGEGAGLTTEAQKGEGWEVVLKTEVGGKEEEVGLVKIVMVVYEEGSAAGGGRFHGKDEVRRGVGTGGDERSRSV